MIMNRQIFLLKPNLSLNNSQLPSWIAIRLLDCFVLKTSNYKTKQLRSLIVIQLVGNCL